MKSLTDALRVSVLIRQSSSMVTDVNAQETVDKALVCMRDRGLLQPCLFSCQQHRHPTTHSKLLC